MRELTPEEVYTGAFSVALFTVTCIFQALKRPPKVALSLWLLVTIIIVSLFFVGFNIKNFKNKKREPLIRPED